MRRPEPYTRLLFPGALAYLTGIAVVLNLETLMLSLFLVGLIYPGLILSGLLAISVARIALPRPVNWTMLSLAGLVLAWATMVGFAGYGMLDVSDEVLAATSIAVGVVCLLVPVWKRWGQSYAIVLAAAMTIATGLPLMRHIS